MEFPHSIVAEETVTFSMTFTPEQLQIFETRYENGYVNYIASHVCTSSGRLSIWWFLDD